MINALSSLKSDADFDNETSQISYRALNSLTKDDGAPAMDYVRFAAMWDAEEKLPPEQQELHNLVDRFDGSGITLKTHDKDSEIPKGNPKASGIQSMAKRAAAKELG